MKLNKALFAMAACLTVACGAFASGTTPLFSNGEWLFNCDINYWSGNSINGDIPPAYDAVHGYMVFNYPDAAGKRSHFAWQSLEHEWDRAVYKYLVIQAEISAPNLGAETGINADLWSYAWTNGGMYNGMNLFFPADRINTGQVETFVFDLVAQQELVSGLGGDIGSNRIWASTTNTIGLWMLEFDFRQTATMNALQNGHIWFDSVAIADDPTYVPGSNLALPTIQLNGQAIVIVKKGVSWADPGFTAFDNVSCDLSSSVEVGGDTVDTSIVGTFHVTYHLENAAGSADAERTVVVKPDVLAWNMYDEEEALPWVAKPAFLGQVETIAGNVMRLDDDGTQPGGPRFGPWTDETTIDPAGTQYMLINAEITMTDTSGLPAQGLVADFWYLAGGWHELKMNFPTAMINSGFHTFVYDLVNHMNVNTGQPLPVAYGTAPWPVSFNQMEIDFGVAGTANLAPFIGQHFYIDWIAFSDQSDFTPPDGQRPVISLNGPATLNIYTGATWNDPVTASDDVDGDITDQIVFGGDWPIDTDVPGTYVITYDVSDAAGNPAVQQTRTVTVALDSDADGLPDSWEDMFFGDLSQGPSDDPDGDGQNNLTEYNNGTDPNDPYSHVPVAGGLALTILAILVTAAGLMAMRRRSLFEKH